jgi:hypothetical protein
MIGNTEKIQGKYRPVSGIERAIVIKREIKSILGLVREQRAEIALGNFKNITRDISMGFLMDSGACIFIRAFHQAKKITLRLVQKDLQIPDTVPSLNSFVRHMALPDQVRSQIAVDM